MSSEMTTAVAGVLGAAIGVGGGVIGALMNGRSQRDLAQSQWAAAQHQAERAACTSFLACLDLFLIAIEELVWAKGEASRTRSDIGRATAELITHYRSAWYAFLTANAALQLADRHQHAELATVTVECAKVVNNLKWNYVDHGDKTIEDEYGTRMTELQTLREKFTTSVRNGSLQ
jgi:hypothetical protein